MALYAISDLHLGFYHDKSMDMFGSMWVNHTDKIKTNWAEKIKDDDTVLISGDISWAMTIDEAMPDLVFIDTLSGKKIIHSGNHDYWWNSTSRLNEMFDNIFFMKNTYAVYNDYAICGSRGWLCPNDRTFTAHDNKIYNRELLRLNISIGKAMQAGYENILLSLHYPPTNDKKEDSGFTQIINEHNIKKVIYGHLHGANSFNVSLRGFVNGVDYSLVSADYLDFSPKLIFE